MGCLNVIWMVISPRSAHPFWIPVVRHDVVIVAELFVADRALSVLFDDLPVQELAHLGRGPQFPISPRVMRIFNAPHSQSHQSAFFPDLLTATAET